MAHSHSFFYRLIDVFIAKNKLTFKQIAALADNKLRVKLTGKKERGTHENQ